MIAPKPILIVVSSVSLKASRADSFLHERKPIPMQIMVRDKTPPIFDETFDPIWITVVSSFFVA